jgi:hypothetical protein
MTRAPLDTLGMIVTGVLPLVVIGAGIAALVAVRDRRTQAVRLWASIAGIAFLASLWVLMFVLAPQR